MPTPLAGQRNVCTRLQVWPGWVRYPERDMPFTTIQVPALPYPVLKVNQRYGSVDMVGCGFVGAGHLTCGGSPSKIGVLGEAAMECCRSSMRST